MYEVSRKDRTARKENTPKLFWPLVVGMIVLGINNFTYASDTAGSVQAEQITVYKSPSCGCCDAWTERLQESGFEVDVVTVNDMGQIKKDIGVPRQFSSCHTAVIGDYWVEGHVPVDLIQKLLAEHPKNIKGLAVPGMPAGSPGMESPDPVTYDILSIDDSGNVEVYATRKGEEQ